MKSNEENREELNYKEAYYFLFNKVTDTIKSLQAVQRKAENICIGEMYPDDIEIDTEKIIKNIADNVNEKNQNNF